VLVVVPVDVVMVLVAVVLVPVTLTVVIVAVTILMSGAVTTKEELSSCRPICWKLSCRDAVKSEVSLAACSVASKIWLAESKGATISNPTFHSLSTDRLVACVVTNTEI